MDQSRRLRRSPRSKQDKVSCPYTHRKQSISDKFQIGLGKYVHDVEFSQPIEPSNTDAIDEIDCQQSIPCSSGKSHSSDDHSDSVLSVIHKPGGQKSASVCAKAKVHDAGSDMRKKYQEYKDSWNKYPQSQESRPMRLMEFMWSQCKPTGDYQYDMNDPRDKKLHDCEQRNNQIRREYQDMFAEPAQTNKSVDTEEDMSDDFSVKSQLSQQSLVDCFFVKDAEHSIDEYEKPHSSDHISVTTKVMLPESDSEDSHNIHGSDNSSVSSSVVIPNSGDTLPVLNTINNEVAVDLPAVGAPNMNNPFGGNRRLKCHVPSFYYAIYHSDESDNVKLKKLKRIKLDN